MSLTDWMVVAGGLAAIAWVNWYFFLVGRAGSRRSRPSDGRTERATNHGNGRG